MAANDADPAPVTVELPPVYSPLRLQSDYATSLMAAACYGAYILMCIVILRQFHRRRAKRGKLDRAHRLTLAFTIAMLVVTTGWFLASALYNALLLAGGVLFLPHEEQRTALNMCNPKAIARDVFKGAQLLLADGLLLWRAWVVWDKNHYVVILPGIVWLGLLGTSVMYSLLCLDTARVNPDMAIPFNLAQTALSIAVNLFATGLIAGRLLVFRRDLRALGVSPSGLYTSLSAIFVESAALYTACGALYLPFAEADSALVDPFAMLVRSLSFLGPALIQLRIADGTAYAGGGIVSGTAPRRSTIVFTPPRVDQDYDGDHERGIAFATRSAVAGSGAATPAQWDEIKSSDSCTHVDSLIHPPSVYYPATPTPSVDIPSFQAY